MCYLSRMQRVCEYLCVCVCISAFHPIRFDSTMQIDPERCELACVAACCSVLQRVAAYCNVL